MCELAFEDTDGVIISDCEIKRGGRSFTYDTLKEFARPDVRLFLMCGTDMVLTFDQWYKFEEIFKLCYPVYIRREADKSLDDQIIQKIAEYNQKYGKVVRRITAPPIDLSSSTVRAVIAAGKSVKGLVDPAVEAYIKEKNLYKA